MNCSDLFIRIYIEAAIFIWTFVDISYIRIWTLLFIHMNITVSLHEQCWAFISSLIYLVIYIMSINALWYALIWRKMYKYLTYYILPLLFFYCRYKCKYKFFCTRKCYERITILAHISALYT